MAARRGVITKYEFVQQITCFWFQIMKEIQEHKIKIYEFPETDDEEENKIVKKIKVNNFTLKNYLLVGEGRECKAFCH